MLALISPAKSMQASTMVNGLTCSQPHFQNEIKKLISVLQKYKPKKLMELMDISEQLAKLNTERYTNFQFDFNIESGARPALTSFNGDVYLGMDAKSFTAKELAYADQHIRILSGLYGLLRPLDIIHPYRLEMGSSLKVDKFKNLYAFWGEKIANYLMQDTQASHIINLASDEYFQSVRPFVDKDRLTHINFMEEKNGKWTFISFNAKKARGLMCQYLVKTKATKPKDLLAFNYEDYTFNEDLSFENEWIFTRKFIPISEKRASLNVKT